MTRNPLIGKVCHKVEVTTLLRVHDGDTFYVNINSFPPLLGNDIGIRIRGIDAPEIKSKVDAECKRALMAKHVASSSLYGAKKIVLKNLTRGKYFRLIADVYFDGVNLAGVLLGKGLVDRY